MALGSSFISNVSASRTSEIAGQDVELFCREILPGVMMRQNLGFLIARALYPNDGSGNV